MAAGDLVVQENQIELWRSDTDRLLLGPTTSYHILTFQGVDVPGIRSSDSASPFSHGSFGGRELLSVRAIEASLLLQATTQAALRTLETDLGKAFRPLGESEADPIVTFRLPGDTRKRVTGRPRRAAWAYRAGEGINITRAEIAVVCLDPRIYDHMEETTTITIASGSSSQSGTPNNGGNFPAPPILSIVGPALNPRIANAQDGNRSIKVDYNVLATDTLDIDVLKRTVKLNGTDRFDLVRTDNQWWEIQPGANTITFSRTGTTGSAVLTLKHRDTWLGV